MSVTTDSENQSIGGAVEASPADSMSGTTITIVVDNHVENGLMEEHGLALWIQTGEGLVVCVGCCHAGPVNSLRYVTALTGETTIRAVIGGFHLVNADRRRLDETVRALKVIDPAMIVPCHCAGDEATEFLRRELGGRVRPGAAGMTFRF